MRAGRAVIAEADPADRTGGYETARPDVQAHVPPGARTILELGCSAGALGAALKAAQSDRIVVGVELDPEYAAIAATRLDRVVAADAETFLTGPAPVEAPFDCLICADVLEHLVDPWSALRRAAKLVAAGGTVIVSVPNVLFWQGLLRVIARRRWPREDEGVFDRTHLRWFARADAVDLMEQAGLTAIEAEPRYFCEGAKLRRRRALAGTPLAPYLPAQYILTGRR